MNGSTVGVAGLVLVGLGFAGAGLVPSGQQPSSSPDPAAWAAELRAENADDPIVWRYDTRTSGNGGAPIYYRDRDETPLTGGPWIER